MGNEYNVRGTVGILTKRCQLGNESPLFGIVVTIKDIDVKGEQVVKDKHPHSTLVTKLLHIIEYLLPL